MTPNNRSFVKYIQLISALPLKWINSDYPENGLLEFKEFKKKLLSQIEFFGQSNKKAYTFLRKNQKFYQSNNNGNGENFKNISGLYFDWKKVYKNNYFSTIETKLRFFHIGLNLRSLVTNERSAGFRYFQ